MNIFAFHSLPFRTAALLGILLTSAVCGQKPAGDQSGSGSAAPVAPIQAGAPLSANDVSWLFPVPTKAADFANLIAVRDLTTPCWTAQR